MMDDDVVVVIGSGPAGAMAAARLVERGVRVTMLDSGARAPKGVIVRAAGNTVFRRQDPRYLEHDRHRPAEGGDVEWTSSRTNGGLSNYWTAAVPRFAPEDFTEGGRLDERYVWPVSYEELADYYRIAEEALVVTAGSAIANVPANVARYQTRVPSDWKELVDRGEAAGHHLGSIPMAKGTPWMFARRGTEFSSYHCIVRGLEASGRLNLVRSAHATHMNWNSQTGVVDSVDYVNRHTGEVRTVRARAFVVAAGAIDSTVLLLRSVSPDFPTGLGNTTGVIGRYLHDHPREWWAARPSRPMTALAHPLYLSRAAFGQSAPLMGNSLTLGLARPADRVRTWVRAKASAFGVQAFGTMVPLPEVGVRLSDETDAHGLECRPIISLSFDQTTIDNLVASRDRLTALFADGGMDVSITGPFQPQRPGSSVHLGGTVRMHESPAFGALDRWNRLHDVANVLVCDSSCFTTGPEKNPALTAMAIAARASDHLASGLS
jgi:choline dehydrogenase-like flavoprotein